MSSILYRVHYFDHLHVHRSQQWMRRYREGEAFRINIPTMYAREINIRHVAPWKQEKGPLIREATLFNEC